MNPLHYTYEESKDKGKEKITEEIKKPKGNKAEDSDDEYEEGTVEYVLNYIFDICNEGDLDEDDYEDIYEIVDESEQFKLFLKVLHDLSKKVKHNGALSSKYKNNDDTSSSTSTYSENIDETLDPVYENNNLDNINNEEDAYQIKVTI